MGVISFFMANRIKILLPKYIERYFALQGTWLFILPKEIYPLHLNQTVRGGLQPIAIISQRSQAERQPSFSPKEVIYPSSFPVFFQ